jgi:hypothetical protein
MIGVDRRKCAVSATTAVRHDDTTLLAIVHVYEDFQRSPRGACEEIENFLR